MEAFEEMIYSPNPEYTYILMDIPNQIKYSKQHQLKVGMELFAQDGKLIGVDFYPRTISEIVDILNNKIRIETEMPNYIFIIRYIDYKSGFHKRFRWVLKNPIKEILVDAIDKTM